jgi:hypothetical protein
MPCHENRGYHKCIFTKNVICQVQVALVSCFHENDQVSVHSPASRRLSRVMGVT